MQWKTNPKLWNNLPPTKKQQKKPWKYVSDKKNKLRIKSLTIKECYLVNLFILKPHLLSFFPTKKIFEQRWNPITWKFIWELYVSFPTQLKAEEFSREARKISDAPREIWLGSTATCSTTNAWVSPRAMCGDERSLIYKLERQVPPRSVLSLKGRKIKQYKVNLEEWAATAELGKRNEKENELATSSPSTLKLCEENLSPWLKCNLQMNRGWYSGLIHSDKQVLVIKFNALPFMSIILYKDIPINIYKINFSLFGGILRSCLKKRSQQIWVWILVPCATCVTPGKLWTSTD